MSDLITASHSDMMGCVSYLNLLLSLLSLESLHQGKKWCFFSTARRGWKFRLLSWFMSTLEERGGLLTAGLAWVLPLSPMTPLTSCLGGAVVPLYGSSCGFHLDMGGQEPLLDSGEGPVLWLSTTHLWHCPGRERDVGSLTTLLQGLESRFPSWPLLVWVVVETSCFFLFVENDRLG